MPELRKVEDSTGRIRYAHPHARGWVAAAVGAAGGALALRGLEGGGRWVALAVAALFLLGGLSATLSRFASS